MHSFFSVIVPAVIGLTTSSTIFALDWQLQFGLEGRAFAEEGPQDQAQFSGSAWVKPELFFEFNEESDQLLFTGFYRGDQEDDERTHGDIREAYWLHISEYWETRLGVAKVYWGVTESQHLVDIVNQTDLVESPDGEEKLGQPMFSFSTAQGSVILDFIVMPWFRERTFPGEDGRLGLPLPVDLDNPVYESDEDEEHVDFAVRYAIVTDFIEFSLSHFNGTSREPLFRFNGNFADPKLIPYYPLIEQTGLVSQLVAGSWLVKFEGIIRSGFGEETYGAITAGFEFTQGAAFGSDADLGWILEGLWDERGDEATSLFERDVFLGWRLAFNDIDSTEILFGVIHDTKSGEQVFGLEASTRWGDAITVNFEARAYEGGESLPEDQTALLQALSSPDPENKTGALQTEDFVQLEITYYF